MSVYAYRLLACSPLQHTRVLRHVVDHGGPAIAALGGRLFGVFASQIGLPRNQAIVLSVWPDAIAAAQHGDAVLAGSDSVTIAERALWDATVRPAEGAVIGPVGGIVTHRWFQVRDADVAQFLELSDTAWGNFEETEDTKVIGLWRNRQPQPGVTDLRRMTCDRALTAWDKSRCWSANPNPAAAAAHARFRARYDITLDSNVVVTGRIV